MTLLGRTAAGAIAFSAVLTLSVEAQSPASSVTGAFTIAGKAIKPNAMSPSASSASRASSFRLMTRGSRATRARRYVACC